MTPPSELVEQYRGNVALASQWLERNGLAHWERMRRSGQQRLVEPRELPILCLRALKMMLGKQLPAILIPQGGEILYDPLCNLINVVGGGKVRYPALIWLRPARGSTTQVGATETSLSDLLLASIPVTAQQALLQPDQVAAFANWWLACSAQQKETLHLQAHMPLSLSAIRSWSASASMAELVSCLAEVGLDPRVILRRKQNQLFRAVVSAIRSSGFYTPSMLRCSSEEIGQLLRQQHEAFSAAIFCREWTLPDLDRLERSFRMLLREQIRHFQQIAPEYWTAPALNIVLSDTPLAREVFSQSSFLLLEDSTVTGETWLYSNLFARSFNRDARLLLMPFRDREYVKGHDSSSIAQLYWQTSLALEEDYQAYSRFLPGAVKRAAWLEQIAPLLLTEETVHPRYNEDRERWLLEQLDQAPLRILQTAGISLHLALQAVLRGTPGISWTYLKEIAITGHGYRDSRQYKTVLAAMIHLRQQIELLTIRYPQKLSTLTRQSMALQVAEEAQIARLWEKRRERILSIEQMTIDVIGQHIPLIQGYMRNEVDEDALFSSLYARITPIPDSYTV